MESLRENQGKGELLEEHTLPSPRFVADLKDTLLSGACSRSGDSRLPWGAI